MMHALASLCLPNLIVFMSPEVGVQCPWRNIFQTTVFKKHLALLAVDEAHCIPEWYYFVNVFLVAYLQCVGGQIFEQHLEVLGGLRALVDVPFMALSASAPPDITREIIASLHLNSPVYVSHNLDRPNIFLSHSKSKGLAVSIP